VPKVITVAAKAGPEGKLFGSITANDVVEAVKAQTGIELDRRDLEIDQIKTLGQHTLTASLHADVSFPITIEVEAI
jgi:large subunit ribosomal protein L9